MLSQAERSLRGRIGALTVHRDGKTNTGPARAAFAAKFYEGIPADLPAHERDRRAGYARSLHFARLAAASVKARRLRAR